MVSVALRCAIAIAALTSIRYSSLYKRVDVSVPAACAAGVANETVPSDNGCVYRNVSVRGSVVRRNFYVYGPTEVGVSTKDFMFVTVRNDAGFTWRTLFLLVVAVAMWVPSLISLFKKNYDSTPAC